MKTITFDAHLIELDDLLYVQDHVLGHQPCVAYYKIVYPQGNSAYFLATASGDIFHSTSIGENVYEAILRINK